jgi:RNA polymerase sigma-70 factor (ECF subfamily)
MTYSHAQDSGEESPTSTSLLLRARACDASAWNRLVNLYTPLIYRWCRRAGLQAADAADVGQEVFRAVARKLSDFRRSQPGDSFRAWLRIITLNKLRDHARHLRKERTGLLSMFAAPGPADAQPGTQTDTEEKQLLYARALEQIRAAFEPRTWQAFWRVAVDNEYAVHVAADLGMSCNSVYLAKSRVLRKLREEFEDLLGPDLP